MRSPPRAGAKFLRTAILSPMVRSSPYFKPVVARTKMLRRVRRHARVVPRCASSQVVRLDRLCRECARFLSHHLKDARS